MDGWMIALCNILSSNNATNQPLTAQTKLTEIVDSETSNGLHGGGLTPDNRKMICRNNEISFLFGMTYPSICRSAHINRILKQQDKIR